RPGRGREGHKILDARLCRNATQINIDQHGLPGSNIQIRQFPAFYHLPVGCDPVAEIIVGKIDKKVLIRFLHLSLLRVFSLETNILIYMLHLITVWLETPVRIDNTVDQEITIGWRSRRAIVTAIGPELTLFVVIDQALVHPVPDKTTLQIGIFLNYLPVIL